MAEKNTPDRILANKLSMEMIKSFEVSRGKHSAKASLLETASEYSRLSRGSQWVKVPRPFTIDETEESDEEKCREEAARIANERKDESEQALRDGDEDQAWSLPSAVAQRYHEWRCSSSGNDKHKGVNRQVWQAKDKGVLFQQPALVKDLVTAQPPDPYGSCRVQGGRQRRSKPK